MILSQADNHQQIYWPPAEYKPLWHQLDFHNSKAKYKSIVTGIGAGKTTGGAQEAYGWCMLYPGCSGAIIVPDFRTWRNVIRPELEKWWPTGTWEVKKENELIHVYAGSETSKVYICSASNIQHVRKINGLNLRWFWLEEGARMMYGELAWKYATGRLRETGPRRGAWVTMSPAGFNWFTTAFGIDSALPEIAYTHGVTTRKDVNEKTGDVTEYYVRCAQTDWNIHLPSDYYSSLLAVYGNDPRFVAQELRGQFLAQQDLIFWMWSKPLHVVPHSVAMDIFSRCPYREGGVDWGDRTAAMTWGGITPGGWSEGTHVTIGEFYREKATAQELGALAHRLNQEHATGSRPSFRWYCDPESPGSIREWRSGFVWKNVQYPRVPRVVPPSSIAGHKWNQWKAGVDLMRVYLAYEPKIDHPAYPKGNQLGGSRWYVSEKCVNLIKEMAGYMKSPLVEGREAKRFDDTVGEHHAIDTCRYRALGCRQVYEAKQRNVRGV